jgi:hypothetical protein
MAFHRGLIWLNGIQSPMGLNDALMMLNGDDITILIYVEHKTH